MTILEQNENYTLALEWMKPSKGGWWLELIDRKSGNVKLMTSIKKDMFDGVTIDHALRWMDNRQWEPMYKANVM